MDNYESQIGIYRDVFAAKLGSLYKSFGSDPKTIAKFLINYCSLGVQMTESVPSWIKRAGENCKALGLVEVGASLISHASHEDGHHLLMVEDTKNLVNWYNNKFSANLLPESFLSQPDSPGVIEYKVLHEVNIAGPSPYGQVAIEYEIERISVEHGPKIIGFCVQVLGPEIVNCLSFLKDHIAFDVGHTKYNAAVLSRLLAGHPEFLGSLVDAGKNALNSYANYLEDCHEKAKGVVVPAT